MKIERKLNKNKKSTDLFKEETGKVYEVNTDHKTFLLVALHFLMIQENRFQLL